MNKIPHWILAASLLGTWLTGCRQVSTSPTPCGQCPACRAAAAAKAQNAQPRIVAVEVVQGPNKETIYVVPEGSGPALPLPKSAVSVVDQPTARVVNSSPPAIVDGPAPAPPLPFPEEPAKMLPLPAVTPQLPASSSNLPSPSSPSSPSNEDVSRLKAVAASVPSSNPVMPTWTSPNEKPNTLPPPAAVPFSTAENKATPIFSHSDDYRVLVGQVQSWRHGWRLRYADFSTEDQHGGSVVLEGASLGRLREGSLVRVQGTLIPATERAAPARFQVQSVEVLNR